MAQGDDFYCKVKSILLNFWLGFLNPTTKPLGFLNPCLQLQQTKWPPSQSLFSHVTLKKSTKVIVTDPSIPYYLIRLLFYNIWKFFSILLTCTVNQCCLHVPFVQLCNSNACGWLHCFIILLTIIWIMTQRLTIPICDDYFFSIMITCIVAMRGLTLRVPRCYLSLPQHKSSVSD